MKTSGRNTFPKSRLHLEVVEANQKKTDQGTAVEEGRGRCHCKTSHREFVKNKNNTHKINKRTI